MQRLIATSSFCLAFIGVIYSSQSVNAHYGGRWGGSGGAGNVGNGGFGERPDGGTMSFLRNISAEGRQQFFNITTNQGLTKAEKRADLQQWANGQSSTVQVWH